MMDRKVQRELVKSMLSLTDIMRKIDWVDGLQRQFVLDILYAVEEQCKAGFTAVRYAYYRDAIRGLTQTIAIAPWGSMGAGEVKDAVHLGQDILHYLIKALQEEKEIKKEIVFLPYKASMWDSLESVWKAAFDDKEHCNTYVIPIPYGDRNPDGTAQEWHCESEQFPDNVPVLDWQEYSFEKLKQMQPDIIYIHNPYDNCNAATSVDMQYYSNRLKECTDILVYIPYFVVGDTISEHFCQAPGIVNADYVIVQDENIKEQYERYYPGGNPPEGKILALGSPKFDKVCTMTRDDYTLPEKWQRLIGDKKVILYNTTLTAMLQHADKFNAKLRYVFAVFKQRDDAVLWWRPHPLLKAAMDSMAPEIREEYRQIEQQYIDESWGIYDDTPALERSIVYTDAYYGDGSSLVWLYKAMRKPILIEDMNCELRPAWTGNFIEIDSCYMWFISPRSNAVFQIDRKQHSVDFFCAFPGQCMSYRYHNVFVKHINNQLVVAPWYGNCICMYNICEKKISSIAIDIHYPLYTSFGKSFRAVAIVPYFDNVFLFGNQDFVVRYNLKTHACVYYDKCFDFVRNNFDEQRDLFSLNAYCVYHACVFLPSLQGNYVIKFSLETGDANLYHMGSDGNHYLDITYDGDCFWLLSMENTLIQWNPLTNQTIQEIQLLPNAMENNVFYKIVCDGDDIFIFPYEESIYSKIIIGIDCKTSAIRQIENVERIGCAFVTKYKERILAIKNVNSCIKIYEWVGDKWGETFSVEMDKDMLDQVGMREFDEGDVSSSMTLMCEESSITGLVGFIQHCEIMDIRKSALSSSLSGECIYRNIC